MKPLGTELEEYSSWSSTGNVDETEEDCSNQIIDTNIDLDFFANAFSDNMETNDSIGAYFSKIFDLLVRPSSIVLLFSIVVTGIVLNSLKSQRKVRMGPEKGFLKGHEKEFLESKIIDVFTVERS